jgi:putrescine aminotransferase
LEAEGRTQAQDLYQPLERLSWFDRCGRFLGGMKAMHPIGDLPIPGVEHVRQPYQYNEGRDMTPEAFGTACAEAIEAKILEVGPENVAAFIGEPVQGAGGVIIPPANYWPQVEAICRKYGISADLRRSDRGFGRTGNMWGHETMGVKPDIIAMAKGLSSGYLPISAVAVSADIIKVMKTGGDFVHGYTYSGHPVSAAVALRNIEIMEREGLVDKVKQRNRPLSGKGACNAQRSSAGRRSPFIGLLGRGRNRCRQGHRCALWRRRRHRRTDGARHLHCKRPDGARHPRQHRHVPAADHLNEQIDELVGIIRKSLDEAEPKLRALCEGLTNSY